MGWRILLWVLLVFAALFFFYEVRSILFPFVVAFIISALLDPSIRKLRNRGYSRFWAVSLVFVLFFLIVTFIGILSAPLASSQFSRLQAKITDFSDSLTEASAKNNFFLRWNPTVQATQSNSPDQIDRLIEENRGTLERLGLPGTKQEFIQKFVEPRREQIVGVVQNAFGSFFGIVSNLASQLLFIVLIPILTFMMLIDMENFKRRSPRWIPPSIRASTLAIIGDIGQVFVSYLRGISIVVSLYICIAAILLYFLNIPYSLLLALLFGILYLVPYVGNVINILTVALLIGFGGIDHALFGGSLSNPWTYALVAASIYFVFGFIFDHFLYPQMVGNSVGLNGITSLFVILCGGALFGFVGMLLAFPLAGSVKVILDRMIRVTSKSPEELNLPSVPLRHRGSSVS